MNATRNAFYSKHGGIGYIRKLQELARKAKRNTNNGTKNI
jgi:hypothetical protein